MSEPLQLQIVPASAHQSLSRDQKRFNMLIRQVEQARAALQAWEHHKALFHQACVERLVPLQAELHTVLRAWMEALRAAMEGKWSRGERETMELMLAAAAAELRGDPAPAPPEVEVDEARVERRTRPSAARRTAAQQRRADEAQRTAQSLREVFRKLAGALHPDREMDPERRAAKTTLMAQVNEAYGRADLLALLELQLRIEQIDAEHLASVEAVRLLHYNRVLVEQLAELRGEIEAAEGSFHAEFGLPPGEAPDPRHLGKIVDADAARLRASIAELRREIVLFGDPLTTRRWVKAQRRAMVG
jgi:hypothetical protein